MYWYLIRLQYIFFLFFRTLQWLSLYNCRGLFFSLNLIETLEELTQLQHLDLSRGDPDEPIRMQSFLECTQIVADKDFLERLLPSLPALTWLDLSGEVFIQSLIKGARSRYFG